MEGELLEKMLQVMDNLTLYECNQENLFRKNKELPILIDYTVRIPPGGNSDALCETLITWKNSKMSS